MDATKYVVKDEHTLGYLIPDTKTMGVLAGSAVRGGHAWIGGPVSTLGATIRPASLADFDAFRVAAPSDFIVRVPADDTEGGAL